jgi:hypothetical protein
MLGLAGCGVLAFDSKCDEDTMMGEAFRCGWGSRGEMGEVMVAVVVVVVVEW